VVSAPSSNAARRLCQAADDTKVWDDETDKLVPANVWTDPNKSTCRLIASGSREPQGIVLEDFRAS
jgi:hypothetical protein